MREEVRKEVPVPEIRKEGRKGRKEGRKEGKEGRISLIKKFKK